jgi:hypothetical protein
MLVPDALLEVLLAAVLPLLLLLLLSNPLL